MKPPVAAIRMPSADTYARVRRKTEWLREGCIMSEFSESYHLRSISQNDGVELLRRAGLKGFVFPPANAWVTIVAEGAPYEPNKKLITANTGVLLHYMYAEDHGWAFSVYSGSEPAVEYGCYWEGDLVIDDSALDLGRLCELVGPCAGGEAELCLEKIRDVLCPQSHDEVFEGDGPPAYRFARLLGLENYRWLSYRYLVIDYDRGDWEPNGAVRVT